MRSVTFHEITRIEVNVEDINNIYNKINNNQITKQ